MHSEALTPWVRAHVQSIGLRWIENKPVQPSPTIAVIPVPPLSLEGQRSCLQQTLLRSGLAAHVQRHYLQNSGSFKHEGQTALEFFWLQGGV